MAGAVNGKKSRKEERSLARLRARETGFHRDSCLPADCGGKGSGTAHAARRRADPGLFGAARTFIRSRWGESPDPTFLRTRRVVSPRGVERSVPGREVRLVAACGIHQPENGSIEFSDLFDGSSQGYDQRGRSVAGAQQRKTGAHRVAARIPSNRKGNLRGFLLHGTSPGRIKSVCEGDLSLLREQQRVSATVSVRGWIVWAGLDRGGVWQIRFLSHRGSGTGGVESTSVYDAARDFPCVRGQGGCAANGSRDPVRRAHGAAVALQDDGDFSLAGRRRLLNPRQHYGTTVNG